MEQTNITDITYIVIISIISVILVIKLFRKNESVNFSDFRDPSRDVHYITYENSYLQLKNKYYLKELEIKGSRSLAGYLTFCGFEKQH